MPASGRKKITTLAVVIFLIATDRFLKALVLSGGGDPFCLTGNFFSFQFAANYGIAFSLPLAGSWLTVLIGIIISVLLFALIRCWRKNNCERFMPLALIIGGAVSNYYDRLRLGFVIDYLNLKYFTVFNIADMMIVGGAIFLFFKIFFSDKKTADC